jgi:hypothetical protein
MSLDTKRSSSSKTVTPPSEPMDNLKHSILCAVNSDGSISRQHVRGWIHRSADVEADALLYQLTRDAWNRIEPRLETAETCALIERYLLACIRENPQGGVALTRYEAASELEAWFDHVAHLEEDMRDILQSAVNTVTTLFLTGDHETRNAIETGFLEHVLEQAGMRSLFSHWASDERLADAWRHALAWGRAHPNFTKNLRIQIGATSDIE